MILENHLVLSMESVHSNGFTSQHELKVVYDNVCNVEQVDGVTHGVKNFVNLQISKTKVLQMPSP